MTADEDVLWAAIEGDEAFRNELRRVLRDELEMTARDFAKESGLGGSTGSSDKSSVGRTGR